MNKRCEKYQNPKPKVVNKYSNHSTIYPILYLLNNIAAENDKPSKTLTLSVFIDLSKAFDTISHDILIKKIPNLWFQNYLKHRKQYVDMNMKSNIANIVCGIPQGSILGPILFLIYVNDIGNSTKADVLSIVDDTTVSISSDNITTLYHTINT